MPRAPGGALALLSPPRSHKNRRGARATTVIVVAEAAMTALGMGMSRREEVVPEAGTGEGVV